MQFIRKSLKLTEEQWETLQELAEELKATAPTGTHAGEPSWRSLIKDIADKKITLTEAK